MRRVRRRLGTEQVPVGLAREVAGVEDAHAANLDHEHGRAEHVARVVAPEPDALVREHLVVVDELDAVHGGDEVGLVPHAAVVVPDLDRVVQQQLAHRLGRVRHEGAAAEARLLQEEWERAAVVHVEVGHQQQVHLRRVDLVEEGQRVVAGAARVHAAVKHDGRALEFDHDGRAADLAAAAEWQDRHHVLAQADLLRPAARRDGVRRAAHRVPACRICQE
mmetsp:Transcript_33048/g.108045  ORF Transcript_33048/g.108045 Transcript_33048/m.108045 type:complete len:220 (-) Transcript_33048:10-669(-)